VSDSNYTQHIGPLVPYPDGVPHIDKSFQEEPLHYITESQRNRLLAIEKEAAALREEVDTRNVTIDHLAAENARMRERISDLVLLWSWGAGGKAGTGFAEKLGGDGDGETWAVKFDPMDPDEGCEFVVRVETGQDGLPILDDAARAALGGRDE